MTKAVQLALLVVEATPDTRTREERLPVPTLGDLTDGKRDVLDCDHCKRRAYADRCESCGAYVCEECAEEYDDGCIYCHRCTEALAPS